MQNYSKVTRNYAYTFASFETTTSHLLDQGVPSKETLVAFWLSFIYAIKYEDTRKLAVESIISKISNWNDFY